MPSHPLICPMPHPCTHRSLYLCQSQRTTGLCHHLGTWKLPCAWTREKRNITAALCLSEYLYLLEKVEHLGSMMLFWALFWQGSSQKSHLADVTHKQSQPARSFTLPPRTSHDQQTCLSQPSFSSTIPLLAELPERLAWHREMAQADLNTKAPTAFMQRTPH